MAENNQNKNVQTSGPKLNDQMIVRSWTRFVLLALNHTVKSLNGTTMQLISVQTQKNLKRMKPRSASPAAS